MPPPMMFLCLVSAISTVLWSKPGTHHGHRGHFHEVDYGQFELTPCILLLLEGHFTVELHSAIYSDGLLTRGNGHPLLLLPLVDLVLTFCEQSPFFENEFKVWKSHFEAPQ